MQPTKRGAMAGDVLNAANETPPGLRSDTSGGNEDADDAPAPALRCTASEETIRLLNTAIDDEDGLQVRGKNGQKGLVAQKAFARGALLWTEPPLLMTQMFDCPFLACRHCLRSLGERRHSKAPEQQDSNDDAFPIPSAEDVWQRDHSSAVATECPGACGHCYCTAACRDRAREWYHSVMCSCRADAPERGKCLQEFEAFARLAGNEYYSMAGTGIAMAIAAAGPLCHDGMGSDRDADLDAFTHSLDQLLTEQVQSFFGQFEQRLWWQTMPGHGHSGHKTRLFAEQVEEQTREAFSLFLRCLCPLMRARLCTATPGRLHRAFARLIGAIRMNSQIVKAPHPAAAAGHCADAADDSDEFVTGMALFRIQSCINHSCAPNARMTYSRHEACGHAWVRALRDIGPGEELQICYLDLSLPVIARQQQLREQYGFTCACVRCRVEAPTQTALSLLATPPP